MNIRQHLFSKKHYENFLREHDEVIEFCKTNTFQSDSIVQEASLRASHFQTLALDRLLAAYTGGEAIASLIPLLEDVIEKYEVRQKMLARYEDSPKISPLAMDDWPDQYEEAVQVIGFCVLLHRTDLLPRFVKLMDEAGYAGDDTLYEDLLKKVLPDRHDVDQWYHDVYTPLIQAIYIENKEEQSTLLQQYCDGWYSAFEQAPWHDTHHQGEDGNYVGYWAIEAGAIAFLYGMDDSKIDHMVYPTALVEYARINTTVSGSRIGRIVGGEPCSKTGYWFTPAEVNSRRHFKQHEVMPKIIDSCCGDTLWYWSGGQ